MHRILFIVAFVVAHAGANYAFGYSADAEAKYGYLCQADGMPGSNAWKACIDRSDELGVATCEQGRSVYGPCKPSGSAARPSRESEQQQACGDIRQEIARQRSIAQYSRQLAAQQAAQDAQQDAAARRNPMANPIGVRLPSRDPEIQAAVAQNIATLETKSADLGCVGAFSGTPPAPTPAPGAGMTIDQCFAKCKQLTQRTDGECFDACKR